MQVGMTPNRPAAYTASRTDGLRPCGRQPAGNVLDAGFTNPPSMAGGRDNGGCSLSLSLALCPAESSLLSSSSSPPSPSPSGSRICLGLPLSTLDS